MNGRDDLPSAIELDLVASPLPEQRFFIWRLKGALAGRLELEQLRNEQLRHLRQLYPGATVSGAAKLIEQDWARYLASGYSRDEIAGRPLDRLSAKREALWRVSVADERPGADLAIEGERLRDGRKRRSLKSTP